MDSSVAAALLTQSGFEVIGISMCFNLPESAGRRPGCCGREGVEDAGRVAHALGIRHYVLNMQRSLSREVIADFCGEYLKGRTPNPCVRCNQYLKFGELLQKSLSLGARYLATGHYARIIKKRGVLYLAKAADLSKDQSYFLYRMSPEQLKSVIFPLAGYKKEEVRQLARKFKLPVAEKPGSQEICFLPDQKDYRTFLEKYCQKVIKPGRVIDASGNIVGEHKGIPFYTIGQRQGLNIALGRPVYITRIDGKDNTITVGPKASAQAKEFLVTGAHFINKAPKKKVVLRVRIRYNQKESLAGIERCGRGFKVSFSKPQFAITPGQSAVFYDKNIVLGGGIIERVLD